MADYKDEALRLKAARLPLAPDFAAELALARRGARAVCGIDEVGRGPLAGPVVTAAVILDAENLPLGLADSKQLSARRRAAAAEEILAKARAVACVSLPAERIDSGNIRAAALAAMAQAAASLALAPDYALIDGRDIPPALPCPAFALIKGDARALSIAAASIIAKEMRDNMMRRADSALPAYGFAAHKGYGTQAHLAALAAHGGAAGLHRFSFAPLKGELAR